MLCYVVTCAVISVVCSSVVFSVVGGEWVVVLLVAYGIYLTFLY